MSNSVFWVITYIIFGFSFLPAILNLVLWKLKFKIDFILLSIAIIEFVTNISNLIFYLLGFGDQKWQYDIYSLIEVSCFLFIFHRLFIHDLKNRKMIFMIFILFFVPLILIYFSYETRLYSKTLQFTLGLSLLNLEYQKSTAKRLNYPYVALSIGLMIYSVVSFNLFVFIDWFPKFTKENNYLIWIVHQFSALLYFILTSLGIWIGRRK